MKTRVPIYLDETTYEALHQLATLEYRDVRMQAAVIVRHELERRGLLPAPSAGLTEIAHAN